MWTNYRLSHASLRMRTDFHLQPWCCARRIHHSKLTNLIERMVLNRAPAPVGGRLSGPTFLVVVAYRAAFERTCQYVQTYFNIFEYSCKYVQTYLSSNIFTSTLSAPHCFLDMSWMNKPPISILAVCQQTQISASDTSQVNGKKAWKKKRHNVVN